MDVAQAPGLAVERRRRLSLANPWLQAALAAAVFFAAACWFTWPMVTDPTKIFYGAAGDPYGTMAFFRELVQGHHNPFLPGTIADFNAPDGQPIPWVRNIAAAPAIATLYLLTALFGPIAAIGVYTLGGYTLSGLSMFLLARRVSGSAWAGMIAGWAFAFYPFAVINGQGHYDYIHGWVLVLGVWRMLELTERPTWRNAVWAGLAVAFGLWWTPYFILLGGVAYAALAGTALFVNWRRGMLRASLVPQAVACAIVIAFLGVLGALSTQATGESLGLRTNDKAQLDTYSARIQEYVVPSKETPVLGRHTGPWLERRLHGSNWSENTLYVGLSMLLLAAVAGVALLRRRLDPRTTRWCWCIAVMTLAALVSSAPPEGTVLGVTIPFPAHFISELTSTWRAYGRFVIVVMLGVALLASVGVARILSGRRTTVRMVVFAMIAAIVALDMGGRLGGRTNTVADPAIYSALRDAPPGIVAEYPLVPSGYSTYNELFFQDAHGKPIVNGYLEGSADEGRALSLYSLSDPSTPRGLAALGVRYVLVRNEAPSYGLPAPGRPTRAFRLVAEDPYAKLYRVTVPTRRAVLLAPISGFSRPDAPGLGDVRWIDAPVARMAVVSHCPGCRTTLTFDALSYARPRRLTIRDGRRVLFDERVAQRRVRIPLVLRRNQVLRFTTAPGPEPVLGPDPRSVSVQVGNLSVADPGVATRRR